MAAGQGRGSYGPVYTPKKKTTFDSSAYKGFTTGQQTSAPVQPRPSSLGYGVFPGYQKDASGAPFIATYKPTDFGNLGTDGTTPTGGYPTTTSGSNGSGRSGGGGGGGAPAVDTGAILALLNRSPQSYQWKDMAFTPYKAPQFYKFDSGMYDTARTGLGNAITADRAAGGASYAQGLNELQQYQNPFSDPSAMPTNPQASAAMQRMMQANGVDTNINQADTNMGAQADTAFGNLLAVLGGVNDQAQASRVRALQGDQRGFNERLDAELRGGNLSVDMAQAQAFKKYQEDKWAFGEDVARTNWQQAQQVIQYNNQGQNSTAQNNTQMTNEFNQGNQSQLIDLIASGVKIDPAALQQFKA